MTDIREAEEAVIGALLIDPKKAREASQNVAPGDFESTVLGRLYSLITSYTAAGKAIDPLTLWPAVQADPLLSRNIDNPVWLHNLKDHTPTAANVGYYARQVADAGQSRRLKYAAARFDQLADDKSMTAADKLGMARKELEAIASDYAQAVDVPTLSEILATPDAEVDWVIPGFLSRRDRFVLTGMEGFGKTTLFRQIMVCAAAGIQPFTFARIRPVSVLVVDTENDAEQWRWETRSMVALAARYGARNPGDAMHVHCTGRLDVTRERDIGLVHSLLDAHRPDILAIGPLYKLSPGGMNDDRDASPVIAALDSIRDRPDGPAMLMEAHAGHATAGDGRRNLRPRGSSMQLGWPEFGVGISPNPDDYAEGGTKTLADVQRWRGSRIRGRHLPATLRSGGDWPWMEDGAAMEWLNLKRDKQIDNNRKAS